MKAPTWDSDPAKVERANKVAEAIRAEVPLDDSVRLLEYGAGTGLVTQALRDTVGPVTLVDTSAGMREVMEGKIEALLLPDARIWNLDLASEPPPNEEFDLIVTVMTLHHILSLDAVLRGFASLLVEHGHLCIVDLEEEDGSFHGGDFEGRHGFSRSELASLLSDAGFADISFRECHMVVRETGIYPLFLSISRRAR
jgi:predicted TPR repeat methyltransferase